MNHTPDIFELNSMLNGNKTNNCISEDANNGVVLLSNSAANYPFTQSINNYFSQQNPVNSSRRVTESSEDFRITYNPNAPEMYLQELKYQERVDNLSMPPKRSERVKMKVIAVGCAQFVRLIKHCDDLNETTLCFWHPAKTICQKSVS